MLRDIMKLPGPAGWLNQVMDNLGEGRNVVLRLPAHMDVARLASLVGAGMRERRFSWQVLQAPACSEPTPARGIIARCIPDMDLGASCRAGDLAQSAPFRRRAIFWVDGMTAELWPRWRQFLMDYQHALQGIEQFSRTLFCVPLNCPVASAETPEEINLKVHPWSGTISALDMNIHCSSLVPDMPTLLRRELYLAQVVELAAWDFDLASQLCQAELETILDPLGFLKDYAQARGWTAGNGSTPESLWFQGCIHHLHSPLHPHSAWLALREETEVIRRRLWRAQVRIIFPQIEEMRVALVENYGSRLRPGGNDDSPPEAINGMEIGQIYQVVCRQHIKGELREKVTVLRDARNALAHLRLLDAGAIKALENLDNAK